MAAAASGTARRHVRAVIPRASIAPGLAPDGEEEGEGILSFTLASDIALSTADLESLFTQSLSLVPCTSEAGLPSTCNAPVDTDNMSPLSTLICAQQSNVAEEVAAGAPPPRTTRPQLKLGIRRILPLNTIDFLPFEDSTWSLPIDSSQTYPLSFRLTR